MRTPPRIALLLAALALLPACATVGDWLTPGPEWIAVDTATGDTVTLDAMADELARRDVVFLGELHDSAIGHELQLALLERLGARRGDVIVSLEMFERDVQGLLDDYLAGRTDEAALLAGARPWRDYAAHYRPVVEWARARGAPVVAANVPRLLAARVARDGLAALAGEAFVPVYVDHGAGDYRDRFFGAVDEHAGVDDETVERYFAAQCLKDEAMAESIVDARWRHGGEPLVVHLCGSFHSDFGLGTVERVLRRDPDLSVGLVTTRVARRDPSALAAEDRAAADYVWLVRR